MIARASVMLVVLLAALTARAAPIDDAKKAFAEGKAAFERGDYDTALNAYQRANIILPAPNLYYNIGATYERLGKYQEAALAFDKYFEMSGAPTSDEDRGFQEKLRVRLEADRKRPNTVTPQPQQQQPAQQQQQQQQPPPGYRQPYYTPQPYYLPPPGPTREMRLKEARSRRTRAIVLMGIGVPLSVAGIGVLSWSVTDGSLDTASVYGYAFLGITFGVVGITLWAPGAASFVKSSHDIKEWSKEPPPPPGIPPTALAMPPGSRGF